MDYIDPTKLEEIPSVGMLINEIREHSAIISHKAFIYQSLLFGFHYMDPVFYSKIDTGKYIKSLLKDAIEGSCPLCKKYVDKICDLTNSSIEKCGRLSFENSKKVSILYITGNGIRKTSAAEDYLSSITEDTIFVTSELTITEDGEYSLPYTEDFLNIDGSDYIVIIVDHVTSGNNLTRICKDLRLFFPSSKIAGLSFTNMGFEREDFAKQLGLDFYYSYLYLERQTYNLISDIDKLETYQISTKYGKGENFLKNVGKYPPFDVQKIKSFLKQKG